MKSGIINVYKEAGYTSFDVVAKLRGILGIRKIGHTGTLDPDATGVLPVCVGKATKVCDLLTEKDKTYRAVMRLGIVTDTQDMSGKVLRQCEVDIEEDDVLRAIDGFIGNIEQIPPMYSALKVDGKKLCDLAREGIAVERKPRPVTIHEITVIDIAMPLVTMEVTCSKGTYIRTLCQDIGEKLGCGACMDSLIRTRVSCFSIEESMTLQEVETYVNQGAMEDHMISIEAMFAHYPVVCAIDEASHKLRNGNAVSEREVTCKEPMTVENTPVRMYLASGEFVGIFCWREHRFRPEKMFLE